MSLKRLYLGKADNISSDLITKALASDLEVLNLHSCDLTGTDVPDVLSVDLKTLILRRAENIPLELLNVALSSSTIEELSLRYCDLAEISVPESLPASLKELDLEKATNIPPELITKAKALPHCKVKT